MRIVRISILLLAVGQLCLAQLCFAQQATLFLVRHADMVTQDADAVLSERGQLRSECLSRTLKDANLSAIYATDRKRTQQSTAKLARSTGLPVTVLPKDDINTLVSKLRAAHGNVLVVGHSETLPAIVEQLGGGTVSKIGLYEFDRLIVVPMLDGKAQPAATLRYCAGFDAQ